MLVNTYCYILQKKNCDAGWYEDMGHIRRFQNILFLEIKDPI